MAARLHLRRVAVALDTSDWETFCRWCDTFGPRVGVLKVGLEAFVRFGPKAPARARQSGEVFLDLKLHDIPNTIAGAVRAASDLGVSYLTVHAAGGRAMLEAAVEAAHDRVRLLAVTVLTHLGDQDLRALDLPGTSQARADSWARLASSCGVAGAVCSPLEVSALRRVLPPPFLLVVPGIRLRSGETLAKEDQKRTASPGEALEAGADFLVIGRPLTGAGDPDQALLRLEEELAVAKTG
jgi:orotidine-5'-phosphate decarboxylase